jgi:hypothetical protein
MSADSDPVLLNLDQFSSSQQAMEVIERHRGFDDVVKPVLTAAVESMPGMTMLFAFCQSAITRARGLYEGVVREIRSSNHPAVFVLMRQLAETIAVARYVADKPSYVQALLRPEKEWKAGEPKRKSIQALVSYMDRHYSTQFKELYEELSELTHFGSKAVWTSHAIVDDEERKTMWSSRPVWQDQRTLYIACAQLLELGAEMELALVALAETVKTETADETTKVGDFFDPLAAEWPLGDNQDATGWRKGAKGFSS